MFFPPVHALANKFARQDHKWPKASSKEQRKTLRYALALGGWTVIVD
jgi:hypothetical protein